MKKLVMLLLFVGSQSIMLAQSTKVAAGWHKIGETTVDFKKEIAEVPVIGEKRYNSIKLRIVNAPINLESFDIYFETGEMQRIDIHQFMKTESETNAIVFKGGKEINRVEFRYKNIGISSKAKPVVELWAL